MSWQELFSQRIRWQRGELEVMAMNADRRDAAIIIGGEACLPGFGEIMLWLSFGWCGAFLLPMFPLLGYDPGMVAQAAGLMYVLYVMADMVQFLASWPVCAESERRLLR